MSHDLFQYTVCRKRPGDIDLKHALPAFTVQMPFAEDDVLVSTFQGERPGCQESIGVLIATNAFFVVERRQSGAAYLLPRSKPVDS